jgi:hypothetical protein
VGEGDQQHVEGAYSGPSRGVGLCGFDEVLNISLQKGGCCAESMAGAGLSAGGQPDGASRERTAAR